ncbi:hypothetical protein GN244_ATG15196 [Phytophthora infestans]|uniref:Uncharacterized protein n=1 Tax=Phytophthora infestans TaxID=4787 RepID=A0A833WPC9_PHYIN|nr:hypothetical protein GN244_ATG15196 [Phytophthora infestans]
MHHFALALLFLSVYCLPIDGLSWDDSDAEDSEALYHVLDVEIDATKRQLELYQQKAGLLNNTIKRIENRYKTINYTEVGSMFTDKQQRRPRPRESKQLFGDWFERQGTFKQFSKLELTQLVSFRPNTPPAGRRRKTNTDDEPPLQLLLALDRDSTIMRLFHPTTFKLMWQHSLDLRSSGHKHVFHAADMYFVSDRSAHLAILSTSGDLVLFKLRLWLNRRLVAGDYRRLKPLRELDEKHLQCPAGEDSLHELHVDASQPPWVQLSTPTMTAPGNYLHVDVERVFGAALNQEWQYGRGKVTVVSLYYRVFVVAVDSYGRHLSFYHGENGSFIEDIHTQVTAHDSNVVQLEPIQSSRGLAALATQHRVYIVDTAAPQSAPVVCEAPGWHTLSSIAADPLRPTIIYAGTSTGRALVYKLHNLGAWRQRPDISETEARGPVVCALVNQLMPRQTRFPSNLPAFVQTLPGFLVLGTGPHLALYQLSGSSEERKPTYLSENAMEDSGLTQILSISVAKDLIAHSIGFAVLGSKADGSHHLDIYESRIPPPGTNFDLSWIRVPAMMVCALAAMFWQQKDQLVMHEERKVPELAGLLGGRGTMRRGTGKTAIY